MENRAGFDGFVRGRRAPVSAVLAVLLLATGCDTGSSVAPKQTTANKQVTFGNATNGQRQHALEAVDAASRQYIGVLKTGKAMVAISVCDSWSDKKGSYTVVLNPGHSASARKNDNGKKEILDLVVGITSPKSLPKVGDAENFETGAFEYQGTDGVTVVSSPNRKTFSQQSSGHVPEGLLAVTPQQYAAGDGRWSHMGIVPAHGTEPSWVIPVLKKANFTGDYTDTAVQAACAELGKGFPVKKADFEARYPETTATPPA